MEKSACWNKIFDTIKSKHDTAYAVVNEAITLEQQNKNEEAIIKYKEGIKLIDEALRIQVSCPDKPDFTWEKACVMIQKMKKTRGEILSRISGLQQNDDFIMVNADSPPSYDEAISQPQSPQPVTYNDLANALNELKLETSNVPMEAEVIYVYENVQLYFISPNGEVTSPMQPQTMKVTIVEDEGETVPRAFIEIGTWVYPLIPGVSPCFRTDYGAFILPNVYAETPGSCIGIILPPDTDESIYELLENILYGIVGKPVKPKPPELSEKISSSIVNGAWFLSQGLIKTAEKVGSFLDWSTPKLMNNMKSNNEPTPVPRKLSKVINTTENVTGKAAAITGFVAEQVGTATVKLGQFLAPHIQKQGTKLLSTGFGMTEENATKKVQGILNVTAGAVEGFSTVYKGLENSASILGNSLKQNSIKLVKHKYGQPAGDLAGDSLNTVGNVYCISKNAKVIHPKGMAKKAAKEAGKALIIEHRINEGASTSKCYPPTTNTLEKK